MSISDTYDVVVIGAGAGGMTAAAVAAAEGLRVLLVEKTELVGGTTAWSGGMVWIPVNSKMKQAGLPDTPADAAAYLDTARLDQAVMDAAGRLQREGAGSVVIAGAATAGMASRLQPAATVPLLDGIACAVHIAEMLVALKLRMGRVTPLSKAFPPTGIGEALARLLHGR